MSLLPATADSLACEGACPLPSHCLKVPAKVCHSRWHPSRSLGCYQPNIPPQLYFSHTFKRPMETDGERGILIIFFFCFAKLLEKKKGFLKKIQALHWSSFQNSETFKSYIKELAFLKGFHEPAFLRVWERPLKKSRFLAQRVPGEVARCDTRLHRGHSPEPRPLKTLENISLTLGCYTFKCVYKQLLQVYRRSSWPRSWYNPGMETHTQATETKRWGQEEQQSQANQG